jgi:hypothetical protein
VALTEGRGYHTRFWRGNLRERVHLEDVLVDRRIILKFVFERSIGRAWAGFIWLKIGTRGVLL